MGSIPCPCGDEFYSLHPDEKIRNGRELHICYHPVIFPVYQRCGNIKFCPAAQGIEPAQKVQGQLHRIIPQRLQGQFQTAVVADRLLLGGYLQAQKYFLLKPYIKTSSLSV